MSVQEFKHLPLHDAILKSVALHWEHKRCRIELLVFSAPGVYATPHTLEFSGVTSLVAPHAEAWGPSSSILSCSYSSGAYTIAMQSGDTIEVVASSYTFAAA